jgi:integrase
MSKLILLAMTCTPKSGQDDIYDFGLWGQVSRSRSEATESPIPALRLYNLRHTWATRGAMAGIDLVTLAAMLGHSRIQMVLRYAHPTEEHQFAAMKKLEAFRMAK